MLKFNFNSYVIYARILHHEILQIYYLNLWVEQQNIIRLFCDLSLKCSDLKPHFILKIVFEIFYLQLHIHEVCS